MVGLGCKNSPEPLPLILQQEYTLNIPAPSGLSWGNVNNQLLVVSDSDSKFYRISTSGQIIGSINVQADDLEGIAWNEKTGEIWVLDELKGEVIKLTAGGSEIGRISIDLSISTANNRLEGIAIDSEEEKIYVVNEKDPGMLAVLAFDGTPLEEYSLTWAEDYSGLFYDSQGEFLWIISDQSRVLARCDLKGKPLETYILPFEKAEGLVISADGNEVYIVNDETGRLYVFGF